jgi:hypothetical protein
MTNGLAWFKVDIWTLRGLRRGFEEGICYTYNIKMFGNKEVEEFSCSKWLNNNEDVAYKRIISFTNVAD